MTNFEEEVVCVDNPPGIKPSNRSNDVAFRKQTAAAVQALSMANRSLLDLEKLFKEAGDELTCAEIAVEIRKNHSAIQDLLVPLILRADIPKKVKVPGLNASLLSEQEICYIAEAIAVKLSEKWGKPNRGKSRDLHNCYLKQLALEVVQDMNGGRTDRGYKSRTVSLDTVENWPGKRRSSRYNQRAVPRDDT